MAGSDLINTLIGLKSNNAEFELVMLRVIRDYRDGIGFRVGFKPAGRRHPHGEGRHLVVHPHKGVELGNEGSEFRAFNTSCITTFMTSLTSRQSPVNNR